MITIYIIAAILGAWRLTEILTVDRISAPLRRHLPFYLFNCPRCVSVWAGAAAVLVYWKYPVANIPLAISETYILMQWIAGVIAPRQSADVQPKPEPGQKELHVAVDGSGNLSFLKSDFKAGAVPELMHRTLLALQQHERKGAA